MAQEFNTGLISVVTNFLKTLNFPFTKRILKQRLEANPYYPSLYSISEVFNWYNIENKGLQIEKEQLDELPLPFLAYLKIPEIGAKDFVNVTKITNNSVTYYYEKEKTIAKDDFIEKWSNVVLLAQVNNKSKERDFDKNKKAVVLDRNKKYLLLFGFSLILINGIFNYVISSNNLIASSIFLLFTFIGLFVSVLLLIYEVDESNTFVKNICTGGIKTNCNAVLKSKAAKLFGISWGEIGFFYFCFFALFLLMPGVQFIEKISYISYISVLAAMYIPFSLLYQHMVIKQWCRLCLFVQAVLFLNLSWTLMFGNFVIHFNKINIVFFSGCAIFPIILWYVLKPIIVKANDADNFLSAYKRLFARQDVFNLILAEQADAPDGWQNLGIHKGDPKAENIILKVCSPACKYCFTSYAIFNEILSNNNKVRLVIIYNVTNDKEDERRLPVKHFLALAEQGNGKQVEEAMDYWYLNETRNYDTLKQNFPLTEDILENQVAKIDEMRNWCKTGEITYTPTVFINGKQLPSLRYLDDLKDVF
ncbi:MAG: vitamin K epoxide reductase family protein [Bacteroidota bacterium]